MIKDLRFSPTFLRCPAVERGGERDTGEDDLFCSHTEREKKGKLFLSLSLFPFSLSQALFFQKLCNRGG